MRPLISILPSNIEGLIQNGMLKRIYGKENTNKFLSRWIDIPERALYKKLNQKMLVHINIEEQIAKGILVEMPGIDWLNEKPYKKILGSRRGKKKSKPQSEKIEILVSYKEFCAKFSNFVGEPHFGKSKMGYFNNTDIEVAQALFENFYFESGPTIEEIYSALKPDGDFSKERTYTDKPTTLIWIGNQTLLFYIFIFFVGIQGPRFIKYIRKDHKKLAGRITNFILLKEDKKIPFESAYNYIRNSLRPKEKIGVKTIYVVNKILE